MGGHLGLRLCWLWLELGFGKLPVATTALALIAAALAPAAAAVAAAVALVAAALALATAAAALAAAALAARTTLALRAGASGILYQGHGQMGCGRVDEPPAPAGGDE